jgi:hypothetical protein
MEILDGKLFILGVAYLSDLSVANMKSFESALYKYFYPEEKIKYEKRVVIEKINKFIEDKKTLRPVGQEEAAIICLSRDLEKIRKNIEKLPFETPEENIERIMNASLKYVEEEVGLDLKMDYFIVNKFPLPFDDKPFSIMVFDKADEQKYGIKEGIYFRKQFLMPYRSALGALHELIHIIIAASEPSKLARGLEDGICDFLGPLYLGSKIIDLDMCVNYLKNRRFTFDTSLISNRYLKNLQQAALLYLLFGFEGLWFLVKKGRGFVEMIEKLLISGEIEEVQRCISWKEKEGQDIKLRRFAYSVLTFENILAVTPLAVLIAENIQEGDSFEKIIKNLTLNEEEARKALSELTSANTYLMIAKDDIITSDKSKVYLEVGALRWKI